MKISRGAGPLAKTTRGEEGIIDSTILFLRAIKFITNAVIIGRGGEALFQILKREISGDARKRDRFAISLGQLVAGAKVVLARLVFRLAFRPESLTCSGFSLLLSFPFGFSTWRCLSELGPTVIKNMGAYRYLFYMVGILGTAVVLSQFYNALVSGVFWLFYAAVIFPLAIGTLQFALMILLPPHKSETKAAIRLCLDNSYRDCRSRECHDRIPRGECVGNATRADKH
jgi:hypothetical protein